MNEFKFIERFLQPLAGPEGLRLLDDTALYKPETGYELVVTTDTLVEGVHFPTGQFNACLAQKLLRVNISDLTAKGASPLGYTLNLSLPSDIGENQVADFHMGLGADQAFYGLTLWGGDTTRTSGPSVLSATLFGQVSEGKMITRGGTKARDLIYLTGTIGDSALGLKYVLNQIDTSFSESDSEYLEKSYFLPLPPADLVGIIRKYASGALDISDGLIADAGHLAKVSNVKIFLEADKIPLSDVVRNWLSHQTGRASALKMLLTGGDDCQVLMSVREYNAIVFEKAANSHPVRVTHIGYAQSGEGVECIDGDGQTLNFTKTGFMHF